MITCASSTGNNARIPAGNSSANSGCCSNRGSGIDNSITASSGSMLRCKGQRVRQSLSGGAMRANAECCFPSPLGCADAHCRPCNNASLWIKAPAALMLCRPASKAARRPHVNVRERSDIIASGQAIFSALRLEPASMCCVVSKTQTHLLQ
jgi:hypothetical protein